MNWKNITEGLCEGTGPGSLDHAIYELGLEVSRSRCICGKARYATEQEARRAVKRMKARGRDRSYEGLLHPYMCPERKGIWHVGHTDE